MNNDLSHTPELKLDYKRTLHRVSLLLDFNDLATYNHYCPIFKSFARTKYQDANSLLYIVGVIMAADNLLQFLCCRFWCFIR